MTGTYIHTGGNLDANDNENAAGNMVNFALGSFFSGLARSRRRAPGTRSGAGRCGPSTGSGKTSTSSPDGGRDHRDENGSSLISTLFAMRSPSGGSTPNIQMSTSIYNHMVRDDEIWDASINIRRVGPVSIRGGYSYTKQDLNLTEDVAEIVLPIGGQGGVYERNIHTLKRGDLRHGRVHGPRRLLDLRRRPRHRPDRFPGPADLQAPRELDAQELPHGRRLGRVGRQLQRRRRARAERQVPLLLGQHLG